MQAQRIVKAIFLCLTAISALASPADAQWVKRDDGRFEWAGEIPGTRKRRIRDKLLARQCFYKISSDMGFKGNRLQEAVNIERGPTFSTDTGKMRPEKKVIDSPKGVSYNPSLSV